MRLYITVMAGGLGKRMQSPIPKVLHKVGGIPMLVRIIQQARKLKPYRIIIVVGKYYEDILQVLTEFNATENIAFTHQAESLGTGDAIKSTLDIMQHNSINLILNGDVPLINADTLRGIYNNFVKNKNELQITCINLTNPHGCGRIIVENNNFVKIVEEKDCNDEQRQITLINCGIYIASVNMLKEFIPMIQNNNASQEYYLTDIVDIYKNNTSCDVGLYKLCDLYHNQIANVNTKEQLQLINNKLYNNS